MQQPGTRGGGVLVDVVDEDAPRHCPPQTGAFDQCLIDVEHRDADIAVHRAAVFEDIAHRFLYQVDGYRKPVPYVITCAGRDRGIDADDFPFRLSSGPPELPRLMTALVWMKLSIA